MAETELKLQIEAPGLAGVRSALLAQGPCTRRRLRALYFDTPDGALAAAGQVLRLRREGRRWVQTLKGRGDAVLQRREHEVPLDGGAAVPALDVQRHRGAEGSEPFFAALAGRVPQLAVVFEVDVRRTACVVRHHGTTLEIALDEGHVQAGARREPVCEIEFELQHGPLDALGELAAEWAQRHALWLDVRPKSQRGAMLAHGLAQDPLVLPEADEAPALRREAPASDALREGVRAVLAPLLPNAAALAAARATPEHVHQVRVGLRRLLSLLREFGDVSDAIDPSWRAVLAVALRSLGARRDADVLEHTLRPQWLAAGAPPPAERALPAANAPTARESAAGAMRSPALTRVWIELLLFAQPRPGDGAAAGDSMLDIARPRLARRHRQLRRAGRRFDTLDDAARHRARKRLKRLRYCAEALAALWPLRSWQRYAKRLREAQDALGRFQDLTIAEAALATAAERDAHAWFALGWLAARRAQCIDEAGCALRALGRTPRFLR